MQQAWCNVTQGSSMQSTLLPNQGSMAGDPVQGNITLMDQAPPSSTGTADNVTAQVITLERLAQELQQHLAGQCSHRTRQSVFAALLHAWYALPCACQQGP